MEVRLGSLRIRGQTLPPFPAWGWFLVGRGALSRTGACYREAVQQVRVQVPRRTAKSVLFVRSGVSTVLAAPL